MVQIGTLVCDVSTQLRSDSVLCFKQCRDSSCYNYQLDLCNDHRYCTTSAKADAANAARATVPNSTAPHTCGGNIWPRLAECLTAPTAYRQQRPSRTLQRALPICDAHCALRMMLTTSVADPRPVSATRPHAWGTRTAALQVQSCYGSDAEPSARRACYMLADDSAARLQRSDDEPSSEQPSSEQTCNTPPSNAASASPRGLRRHRV